jgi:hypothetical protein
MDKIFRKRHKDDIQISPRQKQILIEWANSTTAVISNISFITEDKG